jgi:hypothetical protein
LHTKAWVLYAIFACRNDAASIAEIIARADMINHAILTYDEFNASVNFLLKLGAIGEKDKKLFVDKNFKDWFEARYKNKKRVYLHTALRDTEKYLESLSVQTCEIEPSKITKIDFENGVKEYIK